MSPHPTLSRRDFLSLSGLALIAAACNLRNTPPGVPPSPSPLPPGGSSPDPSQPAGSQTLADTPGPAEPTAHSQEPFFIVDGHIDLAWNVAGIWPGSAPERASNPAGGRGHQHPNLRWAVHHRFSRLGRGRVRTAFCHHLCDAQPSRLTRAAALFTAILKKRPGSVSRCLIITIPWWKGIRP